MKKIMYIFLFIVTIFFLSSCDEIKVASKKGVYINEVCSNNASTIYTLDYQYYDWIELYNSTDETINLKNYGLSDNKSKLFKFSFPAIKIEARKYLIVYFNPDKEDKANLIAGFGISSSGEELYLSMPNGSVLDSIKIPKLEEDTTYGRYLKGGQYTWDVLNPTPLEKNETAPIYQKINTPVFSFGSGFYEDEFELEITSTDNAEIYYTLDCSEPTINSNKYKKPIKIYDKSSEDNFLKSRKDTSARGTNVESPVDKGMVVRAIAISEDGNKSEIVTNTYFIDQDNYKTKNANVVSLVTDPSNLIDGEKGIYVRGKAYEDWVDAGSLGDAPTYNFEKSGRDWERECNFTLFEKGDYTFSQDCGMRIHGYGGRTYYIKSFNIYARNSYGEKYFTNPIFDKFNNVKSIVLKYDRYSNNSEKFRDGFLQSLMADTNVDIQEYEMCTLFLNGEYWQTYMIMEKYSDDSLAEEYGVNKEDVVIIKEGSLDEGSKSDLNSYNELIQFAKTAKFEKDINYDKLEELIDIDSFIDFYSTQLYYNHFDFSYRKNVLVWKTRTKKDDKYNDGRWRWMLYDFDYAAVTNTTLTKGDITVTYDYKTDTFNENFLYATEFIDDVFFHNFMENERFKERFIARFFDLANTNFSKENVEKKLLSEYGKRKTTLNTFFENRFEYITLHFANYLNISSNISNVIVETEKPIRFNSMIIDKDFFGRYFDEFLITITISNGDKLDVNDLQIINSENNEYKLKITGKNPKIIIK